MSPERVSPMRRVPVVSLLLLALLSGCAGVPSTPGAAPAIAPSPPPDDSLNATVWFQTAVERDLVFREIYRAAGERLDAALADKRWDALPTGDRDNDPRPLPPAIIVDVDETVLDNSPSQVRQIRSGSEFNEAAWGAWVQQRAAKPLPGALEFLRGAAAKGITVFYISNRDASLAAATVDNLRRAGFPIDKDAQFLGLGSVVEGCEQEGSEKACRRQLVGRRYRVLMQFGDQLGDFVQVVANTRDGRRAAIAPYDDWIGERWWVLPNPVYGAWEPALFDNAWQQSRAVRRAAKEAALDDAR
jgi:acid phosphatase